MAGLVPILTKAMGPNVRQQRRYRHCARCRSPRDLASIVRELREPRSRIYSFYLLCHAS